MSFDYFCQEHQFGWNEADGKLCPRCRMECECGHSLEEHGTEDVIDGPDGRLIGRRSCDVCDCKDYFD